MICGIIRINFQIHKNLSIFAQVFFIMKHVDYIIVGDGFAAMFFALELLRNNQSFYVFSDGKKGASRISAGMVNPVILKKFTTFPEAFAQLKKLREKLGDWAVFTTVDTLVDEPVHRIFHDDKEKETWLKKMSREGLQPFLAPEFEVFPDIENPYGCGRVLRSFRVDVPLFFKTVTDFLMSQGQLVSEKFDYSLLSPMNMVYRDVHYTNIVFAEGISVRENPFFRNIPIIPNKGHHISVFAEGYHHCETFKKKHFLFPYENGSFYYGGTYDRGNTAEEIDENAIEQLENGLAEIIPAHFRIQEKVCAFRPTMPDRKPILGRHEDFPELFVFNGLGTRGLLNAAAYSDILFDFCQYNTPLPTEVCLDRFY